jgi:uncharacterized membrane protein
LEALEDRALPSSGYVYTTLDAPSAGTGAFEGTAPVGINDLGQIVGSYIDAKFTTNGFLLSGGTYTTYDYPGSNQFSSTVLNGVNDLGQAVGYSTVLPNTYTFELQNGVYTLLPPLKGMKPAYPYGINSFGQIVGYYDYPTNQPHGYLLSNGQYDTFNAPNATQTILQGVNDLGQSVGYYADATLTDHGFLLQNGQFTPVSGPPGAHDVFASGINDQGTIVGTYRASAGGDYGFVETGGQYVTITEPNASPATTHVLGINALGQLVGSYSDSSEVLHGFLATPSNGALPRGVVPDQGLVSSLRNSWSGFSTDTGVGNVPVLSDQGQGEATSGSTAQTDSWLLLLDTVFSNPA